MCVTLPVLIWQAEYAMAIVASGAYYGSICFQMLINTYTQN